MSALDEAGFRVDSSAVNAAAVLCSSVGACCLDRAVMRWGTGFVVAVQAWGIACDTLGLALYAPLESSDLVSATSWKRRVRVGTLIESALEGVL